MVYRLGGWSLAVSLPLDVTSVQLADGKQIGLLVGHAILDEGRIARGTLTLPYASISESTWEHFVDSLGGWFVAIVVSEQLERVYLDPMGSMGVVHSKREPVIASTATLIQLALGTTPEAANVWDEFPENRLGEMQSFPGGITADPQIDRILPNHYLDLRRIECVRWWPKEEIPWCRERDTDEQIEIIQSEIRRSLNAVCADFPVYVTLTAGRDTRLILACTDEDMRRRMTFFSIWPTFADPHPRVLRDAATAKQLAFACGLTHTMLPTKSPDEFDEPSRRAYLYRTGYAGHWWKGSEFWFACQQHFHCSNSAIVLGFGGEVSTYPIGRPPAATLSAVTPERLVDHLHYVPRSSRMVEAMSRWKCGLPDHVDIDRLNDLLWLENALACLSLPHLHGMAPFRSINIPFSQRRLIEASYKLSPESRRSGLVAREIFRRSPLSLTSIPCNGQPF